MGTKIYTKEEIRALLERSDAAVAQAVIRLWERQTADEQQEKQTGHKNGVGFTGFDAKKLTEYAEQLQGIGEYYSARLGRWVKRNRPQSLFPNQMVDARKKVLKYAGQLAAIANAKAAGSTEPATVQADTVITRLQDIARAFNYTIVNPTDTEAARKCGELMQVATDAGLLTSQGQAYLVSYAEYLRGARPSPPDTSKPWYNLNQTGTGATTPATPGSAWYSYTDGGPVKADTYSDPEFDEIQAELIANGIVPGPKMHALADVCFCPAPCDVHPNRPAQNRPPVDPAYTVARAERDMTSPELFEHYFGPDRTPTPSPSIQAADLPRLGRPNRYQQTNPTRYQGTRPPKTVRAH